MVPFDGKTVLCIEKPVNHFSPNCTRAKRNYQWAVRCWDYNGRHVQNQSKQYKCWKFWQEDRMYCVTIKGLQNFKDTSCTFYHQQQFQD